MANVILPNHDRNTVLVSHGETVTISRANSTQEEYAVHSSVNGAKTIEWTREEVAGRIETLLEKGFEYKK